jgi:hypothetical protein
MSDEFSVVPEYSQEDIDRVFREALAAAENLHKKLSSLAEDTGYAITVINITKPGLDMLYSKAQEDSAAYTIVASGVDFLRGLTHEFTALAEATDGLADRFHPMINSTGTFSSSTDSGSALFNPDYELKPLPAAPARKSRDDYSAKLKSLDATLGNTYDQVWQTYLGTSSEPHRSALFTMRTLFDNFFAWLAPDHEVRSSPFWHKKDGDKSNQIWRSERLAYALNKHIMDERRRATLEATTKQIGALYEAANAAHNRGALDEDKASKTLMAMDSFLKDWLDSLS